MGRYTTARSFDDRSTEVQAAPTEAEKAKAGSKIVIPKAPAPASKTRPSRTGTAVSPALPPRLRLSTRSGVLCTLASAGSE